MQKNTAKKFDQEKPMIQLLPPKATIEISKVLAFGAKKYGQHNWREGMAWTRLAGACFRHTFAWLSGEDLDPESCIHHLAHAACNLMFLLEYILTETGEDDRWLS